MRNAHPILCAATFYTDSEITWFGPAGGAPDWHGSDNRLGCLLRDRDTQLCLLFNAARSPCCFAVPTLPRRGWQVVIDTSKDDTFADTYYTVDAAGEIWLEARTALVAVCHATEA